MEISQKLVKLRLSKVISKLNPRIQKRTTPVGTVNVLLGMESIRSGIEELNRLNMLSVIGMEKFIEQATNTAPMKELILDSKHEIQWMTNLNNLIERLHSLNLFLELSLPKETADSINIKLPPVKDFTDLSKAVGDLDKAFSTVLLNSKYQANVGITGVESGSIWLLIEVGGTMALVSGLIWSGAVIYKKLQEGKAGKEFVRSLQLKNEFMAEVQQQERKMLDILVESEASRLMDEHFDKNDPENLKRLTVSINLISKLLDKGAEFHPSLVAPENVKNLFPNSDTMMLVESKTKQIEK